MKRQQGNHDKHGEKGNENDGDDKSGGVEGSGDGKKTAGSGDQPGDGEFLSTDGSCGCSLSCPAMTWICVSSMCHWKKPRRHWKKSRLDLFIGTSLLTSSGIDVVK